MSIRIEPNEVRNLADQYSQQAQVVDGVNGTMNSLLVQLQEVWEGESAKAYAARFEELKPGFQKAMELIEEIAGELKDTAQRMEEADITAAQKWN